MAISMVSGVTTSLLLETTLLRFGRDRLGWMIAAKTAAGMSLISMVSMELAENLVDYHLTGGTIQLDSPQFWGAAFMSVAAGFLTPLPYNYIRLRKYGHICDSGTVEIVLSTFVTTEAPRIDIRNLL
ncbi:hypothetical protein BP5796_12812 [Coleophoma crateriformis]|uniref:DUF4396 domain-containing protein n=1 Tax=Coleophoma crateriformis TaxID=565419 RepID=A0A3D8Q6B7_9HELO|nr:hypothetical protein BP5796_12812 [Coleophoma crateriformis]